MTPKERQVIADAQKAAKNRAMEDIRWVMSDARGRRFMWKLLSRGRVFQKVYSGKNGDTEYNLGRKEIILEVFNDLLTACPDALSMMHEDRTPWDDSNA